MVGALDVGTNSILLLVVRTSVDRRGVVRADRAPLADADGNAAQGSAPATVHIDDVLFDGERNARLGQGLGAERRLTSEAMERATDAIASLLAAAPRVERIEWRAAGTSALRDAENRDAFLLTVKQRTGIDIVVIAGGREAELTFAGVWTDPSIVSDTPESVGRRDDSPDGKRRRGVVPFDPTHHPERRTELAASSPSETPLLILADVGGGSTELMWGRERTLEGALSIDVGSSRLLRRLPTVDALSESAVQDVRNVARQALETAAHGLPRAQGSGVVLSGGTAKTLLDVETAAGASSTEPFLARDALQRRLIGLARGTHAERLEVPGLPPERADTIVAGAAIVLALLDLLGVGFARVTRRGLRHGIAIQDRWP